MTFRQFLTDRHGTMAETLLDAGERPPLFTPRTYRDRLASRGLHPVKPERTVKRPGDVVLHSWCRPVSRVAADLIGERG